MTWTKVVLSLVLLVASTSSIPLLRKGLGDVAPVSRVGGDYRLPNNSVPISYDIKLIPFIEDEDFTFDGEAKIRLTVLEPTSTITLHTNALTYNETVTTLVSEAGIDQTITNHTEDTDKNFLIIEVLTQLAVGNYTLSLSFSGILDDDMKGFYRSSYTSESGETVWLATTQFEPTSARRAFPCYDEPALKATFDIGIKHEAKFHALSNMPIAWNETDPSDGKTWTFFETTPVMSTYLVAFVVSDFTARKTPDESFNVWSRPNAFDLTQYAFEIGSVELAELENFTSVTFSLPKMDQIAIPDFSAGAMENWGLVTYRESMFHYNVSASPLSTKQSIASVISHEFGHQWFGNLVSPAWWKYLWLNEGFATYFEYQTTDAAEDNWRMMDQMVIKDLQADAFTADASATSHPMNQDVATPREISAIFDSISYAKAGCVIRMMSHFLTEDVFKAGLTKYLNANAYGAATSDDLFEALQEAEDEAYILPSHVYVKEVMDTWVEQMGYPVVTVTRNYTTATTEIAQERFLLGDANLNDTNEYRWWIPINWATESNPDFTSTVATDWIRSEDRSVMISSFNVSEWVIFNKQQTGFYRVNYDEQNWRMIANYLNSDDYLKIHVLNRAALIDDALNLPKANRLSYSIALELSLYLQREVDYIPWYPAFTGINYLNRVLANTDDYESFRNYVAMLTSKVWDSVGIEETDSDDHVTKLLRSNVINYACNFGLQSCRSSAEAKLLAWLDDPTANPISPTLKTNTICAGLRSANATTWEKALDRYLTTKSTVDQTALLAGLGCSEDGEIINNWLTTIINSTSGLTPSASASAITYVYQGSAYNVDRVFDFLVNNLDSIITYFDNNDNVRTFVTGIAYRMTTQAQLAKLNSFIEAHSEILETAATTAKNYIEANLLWNAEYENEISEWIVNTLLPEGSTTVVIESTTGEDSATTEGNSATTEGNSATTEENPAPTDGNSATTGYLSLLTAVLAFLLLVGTK